MKRIFLSLLLVTSIGLVGYSKMAASCSSTVYCGDGKVTCSGKECSGTTSDGGSVTCDGKTTKC